MPAEERKPLPPISPALVDRVAEKVYALLLADLKRAAERRGASSARRR